MGKKYKQIKYFLLVFGLFCFIYNVWELIDGKYSTKQGVTFVLECLLGIVLIFLPEFISKIFKIVIPEAIIYFYWFFLFISVFVGTSLHMISIIYFWDKILHLISPMLLTAIGYGLIGYLLKDTKQSSVSPWLFLIFGFAFAGLCGVIWEFWEFICDSIGNMNLQRYNHSNGQPFIGREALMDTMGDLFTNTLGALIMTAYSFIKNNHSNDYFKQYTVKKK